MFYLKNIMNLIVSSDMLFGVVLGTLILIACFLFLMIYLQNIALSEYIENLNSECKSEDKKEDIIIDSSEEEFDINKATIELEEIPQEDPVDIIELNSYESIQEEKAIISYDELLASCNNVSISYMDVNENDDVLVKQVDLSNTGKIELDPIKKALNSKVSISSLDHEDEFLNALQQLNNFLN